MYFVYAPDGRRPRGTAVPSWRQWCWYATSRILVVALMLAARHAVDSCSSPT